MPVSGRNATTNEPFGSVFATRSAPETQPPRPPEAFLVVHLHDVIENLEIHRRRKDILSDPFDDVRFRLADFSGLRVFVVQRADRIDTDDLYVGILLLQIAAHPADRSARAH